MRRKFSISLITIIATVLLGYIFILGLGIGFATCKYLASKSEEEHGKVPSVILPFYRWRFHFHHWLCSLLVIGLSILTGIYLITPIITYGLLGGLIFQGIFCYSDWNKIVKPRHRIIPQPEELELPSLSPPEMSADCVEVSS